MQALPLLIVQLGRPPEDVVRHAGEQAAWFAAELAGQPLAVVRPHEGQDLPEAGSFRGAILSGAWEMVTDRLDWSERTAAWLRGIIAAGKPVLGVCYGHQLMAHALGGVVDYHPDGPEMGTQRVHCLPGAADDALLSALPPQFDAQLTHEQSVLRPPPGAVTLGRSAHDARQILRYGPRAWSLQFHPEITPSLLHYCIARRREALAGLGLDVDGLLRGVRATPEATGLLRRFAALA
ncbi:glutamine amidotransferase [Bordetella hinzii]|uniref:glutamine amidotransferase n=1 Tax=Bordetella hinzii TaxID=103855 RepID=UPI00114F65AC|nr:glutamine amidotransferase [Bordetella hinzii]QDJ34086.1 GMP synthase [Bordetella hinzii]